MAALTRLAPCCLLLFSAGCARSTSYWTEQARSADPLARLHAIHALQEKTNEPEVVLPVLMKALQDEDTYVRRDAARALGRFGPEAKEAVPVLLERLRDKEPSVRKAAAQALQRIDANAVPKAKGI